MTAIISKGYSSVPSSPVTHLSPATLKRVSRSTSQVRKRAEDITKVVLPRFTLLEPEKSTINSLEYEEKDQQGSSEIPKVEKICIFELSEKEKREKEDLIQLTMRDEGWDREKASALVETFY